MSDRILVLEDWCPSHIALDLVMPEMDGAGTPCTMARCTGPRT